MHGEEVKGSKRNEETVETMKKRRRRSRGEEELRSIREGESEEKMRRGENPKEELGNFTVE